MGQAGAEIEITPKMIEAGRSAFEGWANTVCSDGFDYLAELPPSELMDGLVSKIFASMRSAAPLSEISLNRRL